MHLSTDAVKGKCDVCGGLILVRRSQHQQSAICVGCYRLYPEHDDPKRNNDAEDDCA